MNQTSTPTAPQTIELAEPGFPMVTRMITDPIFPPHDNDKGEPITWVLSKPHPVMRTHNIVRMFIKGGSVSVYAVAPDHQAGTITTIPLTRIRLVEEGMPIDIFAEELARDEAGEDGDEPDEPDEPTDGTTIAPVAPAPTVNGSGPS